MLGAALEHPPTYPMLPWACYCLTVCNYITKTSYRSQKQPGFVGLTSKHQVWSGKEYGTERLDKPEN